MSVLGLLVLLSCMSVAIACGTLLLTGRCCLRVTIAHGSLLLAGRCQSQVTVARWSPLPIRHHRHSQVAVSIIVATIIVYDPLHGMQLILSQTKTKQCLPLSSGDGLRGQGRPPPSSR